MHTDGQSLKKRIVFLCIVLIFAYASMLLLSHSVECFDTDCAICTMLETSRRMLVALAFFAVVCLMVKSRTFISFDHFHILSYRDGTPVGLKVKLSD